MLGKILGFLVFFILILHMMSRIILILYPDNNERFVFYTVLGIGFVFLILGFIFREK